MMHAFYHAQIGVNMYLMQLLHRVSMPWQGVVRLWSDANLLIIVVVGVVIWEIK